MQNDPLGLQAGMNPFYGGGLEVGQNLESQRAATAIITCPKKMVGRVIGKNGETIKALQNFTGAQIQIDQRVDPTRVSIAGPPRALVTANNMVQDIVAGTFKGFAMLRAYANQGTRGSQGFDLMSQQAPVYIKGYGFVPPSQFAGDPTDPLAAVQPQYLDALPANFNPYSAGYQTGLGGNLLQPNMYAPVPAEHQVPYNALSALAAQAQLGMATSGLDGAPSQVRYGGQMPQAVPTMQSGPMGMIPTTNPGYVRNQAANYGDTNALAAQLEAMNIRPTQTDTGPSVNSIMPVPSNGAHQPSNTSQGF